jgi:hypothetical protein
MVKTDTRLVHGHEETTTVRHILVAKKVEDAGSDINVAISLF